jgi:polyhydroxybutyrate depolymerase
VVYAPRGIGRSLLERFAGLTRLATGAGFVVAYADSVPLSIEVLADLATIPERIVQKWCIDENRVFLAGHSDGGTASSAIAMRRLGSIAPAAIAPSGAGIRGADLLSESCPPPLSVRISHGANDRLFPGFGREAARWWAQCNRCAPDPSSPDAEGCVEYPGCEGGVRTLYCEHPGGHLAWAERPQSLIEFFRGVVPQRRTPSPVHAP